MASEIRVLEDQLYEADYQNEVLRQKLKRAKGCCDIPGHHHVGPAIERNTQSQPRHKIGIPTPVPDLGQPVIAPPDNQPLPDYQALPPDNFDGNTEPPDSDDYLPIPMESDVPAVPSDPSTSDPPEVLPVPQSETLPPPKPDPQTDQGETQQRLPAPTEPQPPGPEDTKTQDVVPGILPPPTDGQTPEDPPGKIEIPEALKELSQDGLPQLPIPERLDLHDGLSGGHRFEGEDTVGGAFLVVNVLDTYGRMIDISRYDVEGDMTVVALDPELDSADARIGRWEFPASTVRQLIRNAPVSGFHVPIKWQDIKPTGKEVVVHVRLKTQDEEMRCHSRVRIAESATIAEWTPRSPKSR